MKKLVNFNKIKLAAIFVIGCSTLVYAATRFVSVSQPPGYVPPMALSNTDLTNGAKGYRPWFENGAWQGDLIEYDITSSGGISTSVDLSGTVPVNSGTNWSARLQFASAEVNPNYWNTGRKIITWNGTNQVAFRWNNLTPLQKEGLDISNKLAPSSPILDFIRGDRSNERPAGPLRARYSLLGDIMHSNPVYVGIPIDDINESSYVAFKNANANRAPRVYVGANDGMLHVFDAVTGNEVYAYIPSMLIDTLDDLAADPYFHRYYVDGELSVFSAYFDGAWHSVLTGGLGAGGKGRFALDVTHPSLSAETSATGTDRKILWEHDGNDPDLGDAYGQPTIAKLNDGNYYIVNGNGYNSANGKAMLLLTNVATGAITKISTGSGNSISPNGLSTPALVDIDGNGTADVAYAGDIDGNMWKFNLTASGGSLAYRLFAAGSTQPITTAPEVTNHPIYGQLVLFGTGKIFTAADLTDASTQGLYAIRDTGVAPTSSNLLVQTLSADQSLSGETVRTITNNSIDWTVHTGWKIELTGGSRLITHPVLRAGRLQTTITNPVTSNNYLLEPSFLNGGAPKSTIFDVNKDGALTAADNIASSLDPLNIPVALRVSDGIMSQPVIASIANSVDTKFINFLSPPLAPVPCTSNCTAGFVGGHIDVDTDANPSPSGANGFSDSTTKHTHEYDKTVGQVYVDYFEIDQASAAHIQINDAITNPNKKFFIVVSNADLSPSSTLTIGNNEYNIVEYQQMIQRRLKTWDGQLNTLTDDNGHSLIVSINDIKANGGTLRHSFNDRSIIDGGLHPTQTGCVRDSEPHATGDSFDPTLGSLMTNGRWRNGALITQAIDPLVVRSLAQLYQQRPTDMPASIVANDVTYTLKEDANGDGIIDMDANGDGLIDTYGGLRANGTALSDSPANGFLWESTLFWHYGDVAKLMGVNDVCYGQPGWEEAVAVERAGLTQATFDQLLANEGFNSLDEVLARKDILDARNCRYIKEKKGGCKKEYKILMELLDYAQMVRGTTGNLQDDPNSPALGTPLVIQGGNESKGVTAGPNFTAGRRSWTDITKKQN